MDKCTKHDNTIVEWDSELNECPLCKIIKENNKKISINLEDKYISYLEYLEKNEYGSKSEIIESCGIRAIIVDLYHKAKCDELRKNE